MPELTPKQLSDLTPVTDLDGGTLFYVCPENALTVSGYDSNYITAMDMLESLVNDIQLPLVFTDTTAKTPAGAINEVAGKVYKVEINGTLFAGSTTIGFLDEEITTSSVIDIYTDTYGINPVSVVVVAGRITLTFEAQDSDIGVKVRIS